MLNMQRLQLTDTKRIDEEDSDDAARCELGTGA